MKTQKTILIKNEKELAILRDAGKILSDILAELRSSLKIGVTTGQIDQKAEGLIRKAKVIPAFKGYRGFPGCICASINEEVVHGIPSGRILNEGDIFSLDIGIIYKDFYSDTALTVGIGKIDSKTQKLLDVTKDALFKGIEQARANNHLSDISHAIQKHVEKNKFAVVREFVGHGIGHNLHEDPEIPNFGPPNQGPILQSGMVFAIEPMVNCDDWKTVILDDGWTVAAMDGKKSAHFEHSIVVRDGDPELLTSW